MIDDPLEDARMECYGSSKGRRKSNTFTRVNDNTISTTDNRRLSHTPAGYNMAQVTAPRRRSNDENSTGRVGYERQNDAGYNYNRGKGNRVDDHNSVDNQSGESSVGFYQSQMSIGTADDNPIDQYSIGSRETGDYYPDQYSVGSRSRVTEDHYRPTREYSSSSFSIPEIPPEVSSSLRHSQSKPLTSSKRVHFARPNDPSDIESHVKYLLDKGFPLGLATGVAENAQIFEHRLWLVDNSGSMQIGDGHRILHDAKDNFLKATRATRWQEIQDTVEYHAAMAVELDSPTTFRLLNDPGIDVGQQEFSVAMNGNKSPEEELSIVFDTMSNLTPGGVTPLTRHIWEIQQMIADKAPALRREGKKMVLVIATDGLPTDDEGYGGESITDEFLRAVKSLEDLPVWLVVRLCTDEQQVTKFYNSLDTELELSLEVLDDFVGEASEVFRYNKWLNYCLPMHRVRELGYHDRLFDLIDERPLTKGEIRDFCCLIFGRDDIPDPAADWVGFLKSLQRILKTERSHWNPIKKKKKPWISLKTLNQTYGDGSSCTIS